MSPLVLEFSTISSLGEDPSLQQLQLPHLAVAVICGSTVFMYFHPSSVSFLCQSELSSMFYTIVVPIMIPLIYIQPEIKDVKVALKKLMQTINFHSTKNSFH